ncbi:MULTISPECIES: phage minor head protein [unclassified Acinetobacter]|uniref:phage head morphogenesis protein n=1 Tax=unclassified Acinetobacter TaxID=196816 RepID=UPI00190C96CF|nr:MULTISPECIES: phage minor head protein [unclassified Acinetobacter]MBK0062394.1 minor capsid protein [Acinetobacter sp. S55]MBK0066198.1 minor capsid protein [Acinetobacter sp. S54]
MTMPDEKTFHAFFGQPPDKAIQYLSDKELVPTKNWYDILDGAHNKAFVISNLARVDILGDIKQSLMDAQKKGLTIEQWRENIFPTLKSKGWWGKDEDGKDMGTAFRMETIYRTNLQSAYMAGRRHEMLQSVDTHPYWRYVAVMDNRTRPAHRALNGKVMPADDPAWDSIFPPNGFNCRCRVSPMTEGAVKRGDYTIETSKGHIETEAVGVGYGSTSATVTKLKLPSMDVPFKTDAGFNSAPSVGVTKQLIDKTKPDILKQLPEHPVFTPENATVNDFIELGKQRLTDLLKVPALENQSLQQVLDTASSIVDYLPHHQKLQSWTVRELERTRQAGTITPEIKGGAQAKKLLKEATKGYPASWMKAANEMGTLNVKFSVKDRGWAFTAKRNGMVQLPKFGIVNAAKGEGFMMAGHFGTAVHEFAHRIQSARPDIDDLFQQEHRLRTANESLQRLRDLVPRSGYATEEVAKPDGYYNAYMGKEYKQGGALEVMTMALQPILGVDMGDAKMLFEMYHKDRRMLELALGILFHCL